ncbi:MAG: hypothetical protein QM628_15505 [Propionicimonas sp.]
MLNLIPDDFDDSTVTARELPRHPHDHPVWEVRVDGELVGWVRRLTIGHCSTLFYNAEAIHPQTGKHYNLENSTDLNERIKIIAAFHHDPMTSEQHLGRFSWE